MRAVHGLAELGKIAVFAAPTAIFAFLFLGERLAALNWLGSR